MDKSTIYKLHDDIKALLESHEIDTRHFQLVFDVPKDYYNAIKKEFSDPRIVDAIVGVNEMGWAIHLMYKQFADDWTEQDVVDVIKKFEEYESKDESNEDTSLN